MRINVNGARSSWFSRAVDRYGGRIVVRIIGMMTRRKPAPANIRRVGLCTFGAIGDAIISSAIIHDLKRSVPGVHVTLMVSSTNQGIAPLLSQCDSYVVLPIHRPLSAVRLIRRERFDVLIDANQWLRMSAVYCALGGATHTIGFRTPGQDRHHAYNSAVPHSTMRHELDNFRALLGPLKVNGETLPLIEIDEVSRGRAVSKIPPCPFIVFHAWAGGSNAELKQWPDTSWVELARMLSEKGFEIVATGSPVDAARTQSIVEVGRRRKVSIISLAGSLSLAETAALVKRARFVVSVNTGVAHLAAAVGADVVCLHGPTNPDRWRPLGPRSIVILPEAPPGVHVGYLNLGFEFPKGVAPCMPFIGVEQVMQAIRNAGLSTVPPDPELG